MSQKTTHRKSVTNEEKEKRPIVIIDNSVNMKKKMAANAEKEKQAAEKADKPAEKTDKLAEKADKPAQKTDKPAEKPDKPAEKTDKPAEKNAVKPSDKKTESNGGTAGEKSDKKTDTKQTEKKETVTVAEKNEESKGEKSSKATEQKPSANKPKQNGSEKAHNGVSDVTLNANGATDDILNGTVSEDEDDVILVIDDDDVQDDLFPELTYEDSDADGFEPPARADSTGAPSRSLTRRSQVKAARTPETPRPLSDKQSDKDANSDESKILKLKDDASGATDRKLRSADSPKPESKKQEAPKKTQEKDSPKKTQDRDTPKDSEKEKENGSESIEVHVVVEMENEGEPRKTDTNYSKSRVKVSPYRRSTRLADQTTSSLLANYTGNNTTMEMDITESSFASEEASLDDSSYLQGLRSLRGRRSYKPLKEMSLRLAQANRTSSSTTSTTTNAMEALSRPMGKVVGRKRKPEADDEPESEEEVAEEAREVDVGAGSAAHSKRLRLVERISQPFRRLHHPAPAPASAFRAHEIVGINTDLPLTVPLAHNVESEALKLASAPLPMITITPGTPDVERDPKRCVVM